MIKRFDLRDGGGGTMAEYLFGTYVLHEDYVELSVELREVKRDLEKLQDKITNLYRDM